MFRRTRAYVQLPGLGPRLIRTVVGSAGLRVAGMLFGFLAGVQLAKGLGAAGYGVYGLAMSVIALMSVVTEFGFPQLLTREFAAAQVNQDWARMKSIMRWSAKNVLLISVAVIAALLAWLVLRNQDLSSPASTTLLTGALLVPIVAQGKLRSAALRGLQQIVKSQLPETLVRPATFSLLLFLVPILLPLTSTLAMGLSVAAATLSLLITAWMFRTGIPKQLSQASPDSDGKGWWSTAIPMALTEGMRVIQGHISVLLLGWLSTAVTVGIFRVASSIGVLMAFPLTLFAIVGSPLIARLHTQGDRKRLQQMLSWMSLGMTVSSVAMALPFAVGGESLLAWVFGSEFSSSNPILLVLCASSILTSFFGVNAVLLNMTGHQVRVMRASWISLGVILLTSPIMIFLWGAIGAAVASSISMLIWNTMMWRDGLRLLSLDASFIPLLTRR